MVRLGSGASPGDAGLGARERSIDGLRKAGLPV